LILAPIVLFVYNRPHHTLRTLEALAQNHLASESELIVFCDGPKPNADSNTIKAIEEVRATIKERQWCKKVIIYESNINKGLADSIVSGVTEVINNYGKIIVLEDDIVTSKGFLKYMNESLTLYENEEDIMHIGSYLPKTNRYNTLPETFLSRYMSCWGWATWKASWQKANWNTEFLYEQIADPKVRYEFNLEGALDFHTQLEENLNGSIKTWAIKWFASVFLNSGLCLYPKKSLSKNIGFDGTGEHCEDKDLSVDFNFNQEIEVSQIAVKESSKGKKYLKHFYTYGEDASILRRAKFKYVKYRYKLIKYIKGL